MSRRVESGSHGNESEKLKIKRRILGAVKEKIAAGSIPERVPTRQEARWLSDSQRGSLRTFRAESGVELQVERFGDYGLLITALNPGRDEELEGMLRDVSERGALDPGWYPFVGDLHQRQTRVARGVGLITRGFEAGKSWPISGGSPNWQGFRGMETPELALKLVEMIPAQPLTEVA